MFDWQAQPEEFDPYQDHRILDAELAYSATYSGQGALAKYRCYKLTKSEHHRWLATTALVPLASKILWQNFSPLCDLDQADDFIADSVWVIYKNLETIPWEFQHSGRYTRYMSALLRNSFKFTLGNLATPEIPPDWKPRRFTEGSMHDVENRIYLQELIDNIVENILSYFRFPDNYSEPVVLCIREILAGKLPPVHKLKTVWGIQDPDFVIQWVLVRLRIALYRVREKFSDLPYADSVEFIFDPDLVF